MSGLLSFKHANKFSNESEVEVYAVTQLKKAGYDLKMRACKNALLKRHWPSKSKKAKAPGYPDLLLHLKGMDKPACVWENKEPNETALSAMEEAQFYIEGLRRALPNEPALPFIAVGYNGKEIKASLYTNDGRWVSIKVDGDDLRDTFPKAEFITAGISASGAFTAANGSATAKDLRGFLGKLRTLYRNIPTLASGRAPIDFTVALLTLKLIIEQTPDWGWWSEIPRFAPGAQSVDHGIGERLDTFARRILDDKDLKKKYADIFEFHEKSDTLEIAFSFFDVLRTIEKGNGLFTRLHALLDQVPPLVGADFDIFGEVYQSIGDEATKKKLGEFFTGRHIISSVLPVLFARAEFDKSFLTIKSKKIADIACGTGGFLTETLRLVRKLHDVKSSNLKTFAKSSFFGYDIGHANASRARVNMYFAGDGFSAMEGGFDSISKDSQRIFPNVGFDVIMTNPPYGASNYGRIEEAFLLQSLTLLKPGTGWLLIVLPTGILENPRSAKTRFSLLNQARITDVISLPKHTFAPYTQQRTAIVIAQKRKRALVSDGDEWKRLIEAAGTEKIHMFIVDNDGFANSDKRYLTDKRGPNGEWLHNDLSSWEDNEGRIRHSKLYRAVINDKAPDYPKNEIGTPLGQKYGVFESHELADIERGISLLPDIPLRSEIKSLPFNEWKKRVEEVEAYAGGSLLPLPLPFGEEVAFLMDHGIDLPDSSLTRARSVKNLFDRTKGNTELTEAMIYQSLSPAGFPVYGGGGGVPRFRADESLRRSSGDKATIFSAPAVVVSMDGSSGSVQVIEQGQFFCNHHGTVLMPKSEINLWCFAQIAQPALRRLASNKSGSATLTMGALENLEVILPKGATATEIEKCRRTLTSLSRLV